MAECNYSIVLDESKGRVLVAKSDIPQGDLILQEAPLGEFFSPTQLLCPVVKLRWQILLEMHKIKLHSQSRKWQLISIRFECSEHHSILFIQ